MNAERRGTTRKKIFQGWVTGFFVLWLFLSGCTTQNAEENGRIAYLNWDENGRVQLYTTNIDQYQPEQLTDVTGDVNSYAVSPDGSQLVYAVWFENGRSELWQLDLTRRMFSGQPVLLLACDNALCGLPVWAPDNRRLIFERSEVFANGERGLPVLWWLDVESGESITVLEDATPPNQAAAISPDGKWLSYSSQTDGTVVVFGLENGRFHHISTQLATPASWSLSSDQLVISDYNLTTLHGDEGDNHQEHSHDIAQSILLFIAETNSDDRKQLTNGLNVDDGSPVWSPNGEWIAFGRKKMFTNTGRQLWLVQPDGIESIGLTNDAELHHGSVSWGENGRFLLHQQFNITTPNTPPSIHFINIETKQQQEIAPSGFQPSWLP